MTKSELRKRLQELLDDEKEFDKFYADMIMKELLNDVDEILRGVK